MANFATAPARPHKPGAHASRRKLLAVLVGVALLAALVLVRATVIAPVRVASASMLPTYAAGDALLVSQRPPDLSDIDRGDLITFRSPEDGHSALKRVIGLPGDSLVILDSELYVNHRLVPEPYVNHRLIDGYYSRTYTVPAGTVFVLGDNRGNSIDSRDYGPIPADTLLGRAVFRLWPLIRSN
ncbi:MAG: signal peptidase I [Nocardioidaceae bacterium]